MTALQLILPKTPSKLLRSAVAVVCILLIWEIGARTLAPAGYVIVPWPTSLAAAVVERWDVLFAAVQPTALEATLGLLAGGGFACLLALAFTRYPKVETALANVAVTVNALPWLAIVPLLVIWFGVGLTPKVIIAALATFFPVLVNTARGLKSADPQALELLHILNASWWQTFWKVRLPTSLPHVFAGLKIAAPHAVLGATIAEWIGSRAGIGAQILSALLNYDVLLLWSTMVVCAVMAAFAFGIFAILEQLTVGRWAEPTGEEEQR